MVLRVVSVLELEGLCELCVTMRFQDSTES